MSGYFKVVLIFSLWGAVFYPLYQELLDAWLHHADNSHGLLVPLVSLYFVWQSRDPLKTAEISNSIWGLLIMVASFCIYIASNLGGIAFVSRLMIISSLVGLILFNWGPKVMRILLFPVLFLIFMVPVPDSVIGLVAFPLQLFATKVSGEIIQAFSIPVFCEGNMLYFVQTQLEVAEACSGIRSIMAMAMLGMVFTYCSKNGWGQKMILILSIIPIALAANIIRISGTGILAHVWGDKVAQGFLHEFSGIMVFVFGLAFFFVENHYLNKLFKLRMNRIFEAQ
jgi:exosortase